jgi:hypothetical protein
MSVLILVLFGCLRIPETIRDIRELPQDHTHYIEFNRVLLPDEAQHGMDARYNALYFAPWHQGNPDLPKDPVIRQFQKFKKNPGYGENRRKRYASWVGSLLDNAKLDHYPNAGFTAITTDNTDLRLLPTHKPVFSSPGGYPFDRLQESWIAANTPLYVYHMTADKAWFLVGTPYATGWMASRCVAFADTDFTKKWERGGYAVVIRDKTPLYDDQDHFLFPASLGSIFPAVGETADAIRVLVAQADLSRKAVIRETVISKESAAVKPLKMTGVNMAKIANELINETYGWGGVYENRDCSAMIRDLYAPFSLWLSRHSEDQAKQDGLFIDLQNLSPEEKERMILKQGIPYLTLLWIKGHIMLYIGEHEGQPLVFHNFWGVRTKDFLGRPGRKIIGQAAITTLHPGIELYNFASPEGDYLNSIAGMTLLVNPTGQEGL